MWLATPNGIGELRGRSPFSGAVYAGDASHRVGAKKAWPILLVVLGHHCCAGLLPEPDAGGEGTSIGVAVVGSDNIGTDLMILAGG
ncbi:hypothetical protein Acor_39500 [Acrocarpospora corrugata]|uniref:Uncharacterized protein n=1 Tax=Acrocarpospora corrugata TaxID=35763 RepID=A0A5M3VYK9_9ACTN|nr:hypothetical protein Acor_39500 [Acrocarpospora corrugata]